MKRCLRTTAYWVAFHRYRKAPFNSRRGDFWWWLSCKVETKPTITNEESVTE